MNSLLSCCSSAVPPLVAWLMGTLPGTVVTVFDALYRLVTSATAEAAGTAPWLC